MTTFFEIFTYSKYNIRSYLKKKNHQRKFKLKYNALMIFIGNIFTFFSKLYMRVWWFLYNFLKLNVANLHYSHGHIFQKHWKIIRQKHTCHMIFFIISLIISTKKSTRVLWFCFLFLTKAKCKLWYFDGHLFSKVLKKIWFFMSICAHSHEYFLLF